MTRDRPVDRTQGANPDAEGLAPCLGIAGWLGFAASPTFATMALLTVASGGGPMDAICTVRRMSPLNGMVPMYLLMSALHSSPWLRLISRRREPAGRGARTSLQLRR